jgi:hypothetical protein
MLAIASRERRNARIRLCVRRCFIVSFGEPITAVAVLARAYPRLKRYLHWHRWSVRRALRQEGVMIARRRVAPGRPCLWVPKSMQHDAARGK